MTRLTEINIDFDRITKVAPHPTPVPEENYKAPVITETADAAANTSTAYSMSAGNYFFGDLSTGTESDWVEVSLQAGQTYTFGLTGVGALDDAANDTYHRRHLTNWSLAQTPIGILRLAIDLAEFCYRPQ